MQGLSDRTGPPNPASAPPSISGTPAPHLRQLHRTISSGPMGSSAKLLVRMCLPGWFVVQPEPRAVPALEGFGPACPPPPGPNNLCEVAVYTHYFYACSARGWPRATLQETPAPSGSLQIIGCKEATCPRTVKVPRKTATEPTPTFVDPQCRSGTLLDAPPPPVDHPPDIHRDDNSMPKPTLKQHEPANSQGNPKTCSRNC